MTSKRPHLRASARPLVLRLLAVLATVCLVLTGCEGMEFGDQQKEKSKPKEEIIPVEVAGLIRGPIEAVLRFSTNLEAEAEVQVFSQASRLVTELRVEEGTRVKKGDLLLRLQDDEQRSQVARMEIDLAKAQREFKRQENLFGQKLVSEQVFVDAQYEVERLSLALEDARRQLSYTEVRAPISGTITQRHVNLGDNVQLGQLLFDMVDFDTIVARIFVPERELPRLQVGQPARIFSSSTGAAPRTGNVDRISPVVDAQSGTVKVTLRIPRNQGLVPGMYVEVELVVAREDDALLVPKRALVYDDVQSFVYRLAPLPPEPEPESSIEVADDGEADDGEGAEDDAEEEPELPADGVVERLLIEPVLADRDSVVPSQTDGLKAGEEIVVAGQAGLKDGAKVRIVEGVAVEVGPAEDLQERADTPAGDEP
ncbi:MAG: efflux RND transporter periplasmic adaptor subunit [Thermoanaerobaculia bacterium]|nr:efflux RND transporter periplasmic adaptor subunit [Thermoanaerobaculia bacterium]